VVLVTRKVLHETNGGKSSLFWTIWENVSTKKTEVLCLPRNARSQCARKLATIRCSASKSSSILGWYSRVTESRSWRFIYSSANQTQFCVSFIALWSQNGSFQTPQIFQFSNRSLFRSPPVVMSLGNGWKSAISTTSEPLGFLRRVQGVTFYDKVRRCEISIRWMPSYITEARDFSCYVSGMCPECPRKDRRGKSYWLHSREIGPGVDQGPGSVISPPTWLDPVEEQTIWDWRWSWGNWRPSRADASATLPRGKADMKINECDFTSLCVIQMSGRFNLVASDSFL